MPLHEISAFPMRPKVNHGIDRCQNDEECQAKRLVIHGSERRELDVQRSWIMNLNLNVGI